MTPMLKLANVLRLCIEKVSNSAHGFIMNPQLEIHSTDEQRIMISGSAMEFGSGQYFHHCSRCSHLQVLICVTN